MFRIIRSCLFLFFILMLSACVSHPKDSQPVVPIAASEIFHDDVASLNVSKGPLIAGPEGQEIDDHMDWGDRETMIAAIINTPIQETAFWTNYRRHIHYEVSPLEASRSSQGLLCKDYRVRANLSGEIKQGTGSLCRVNKQTWQIML